VAVIVYGDFNCPYGYLASQRVDLLKQLGKAELDWRAEEHDPRLPLTGSWAKADRERWERELADVAGLALPGEDVPGAIPALSSAPDRVAELSRRMALETIPVAMTSAK
jgi:hypothetical protein